MEMENTDYISVRNETDIKLKSIFIVNNSVQVVFHTNLWTGKKLGEDCNVYEYLRAVVQANYLESCGITEPEQIITITRSDSLEAGKATVVLCFDVVTNTQDGVDELRCSTSNEKMYDELMDGFTVSNRFQSWPQTIGLPGEYVYSCGRSSDSTHGQTLRWNSEMTGQLIRIRGGMDKDFAEAKLKFHLWQKIADELNEVLTHVQVTAKDCDDKWRNIVATYRKNIDKMKSCGNNNIRWEYFTAMDNILKGTRELFKMTSDERYKDADEAYNHLPSPHELISLHGEGSPVEEIGMDETDDDDDDPLQDCIITRKMNGEQRKWTTDHCLMLIFLIQEMNSEFQTFRKCRNSNLWPEIAAQMNITFLSDFDAREVKSVWNHCNISYDVNLETLKSKGVGAVSWKYFAVMDELRGGTHEIAELSVPKPGEHLLEDFRRLKRPTLSPYPDTLVCGKMYETCSSSSSSSSFLWTRGMINALISLKKTVEQDITERKIPDRKRWSMLARRLIKSQHIDVTGRECEEKWRNLVRTYRMHLARAKSRGAGVIRWPYFWSMREFLGNFVISERSLMNRLANRSPSSEPVNPPTNHVSTLPLSNQFVIESSDEISDDMSPSSPDDDVDIDMAFEDLSNEKLKLFRSMIDKQNEKIEELHSEQLNIKTLLTQILQKLS